MGGRGSGGARANGGPAPELGSLKRVRDGKEWVKLPACGLPEAPPWPGQMEMRAPTWPDAAKDEGVQGHRDALALEYAAVAERELAFWERLWTEQPQAWVWQADGLADQVALYVRNTLEAMEPGATGAVRTLSRQLAGELLLSTHSLHSARYVIDREMKGTPAFPDLTGLDQPAQATGTTGGAQVRSIRDGLAIVRPPDDDDDAAE
jgi:hypothetical protein